jgi:hypothetical protein
MTILDLPPISATLNGLSTLLICDEIVRLIGGEKWANSLSRSGFHGSVTGVYFMLYQWFPSTRFEEVKKRYELRMEAVKH